MSQRYIPAPYRHKQKQATALHPLFFERLVLRLLGKMGYAGKLGRAEHAGKSGDGGIDGILYLDRLELERVYVQAKRWQGSVGASVVRDFAGSMDAEAATKGVILSTSTFTADARAYVLKSPKAIRLVDGQELAKLLVEFEVSVARASTLIVPKTMKTALTRGRCFHVETPGSRRVCCHAAARTVVRNLYTRTQIVRIRTIEPCIDRRVLLQFLHNG